MGYWIEEDEVFLELNAETEHFEIWGGTPFFMP